MFDVAVVGFLDDVGGIGGLRTIRDRTYVGRFAGVCGVRGMYVRTYIRTYVRMYVVLAVLAHMAGC